jgi:hypothetical protein
MTIIEKLHSLHWQHNRDKGPGYIGEVCMEAVAEIMRQRERSLILDAECSRLQSIDETCRAMGADGHAAQGRIAELEAETARLRDLADLLRSRSSRIVELVGKSGDGALHHECYMVHLGACNVPAVDVKLEEP